MHKVVCPHCKFHGILTSKIPKDVIVVMPCPACHEWVVLFWNRILAVSRRILKHGTFEERKMHIANVIAQFFEQSAEIGEDDPISLSQGSSNGTDATDEAGADAQEGEGLFELRNAFRLRGRDDHQGALQPRQPPISQEDIERFVKIELRRIDDPDYFKKNLG